jgi:hypothetical protein
MTAAEVLSVVFKVDVVIATPTHVAPLLRKGPLQSMQRNQRNEPCTGSR